MSAWDAGEEAGRAFRAEGGNILTMDVAAVRAQAEAYGHDCHYRARDVAEAYTTDWLFGFYKALLEEPDNEA